MIKNTKRFFKKITEMINDSDLLVASLVAIAAKRICELENVLIETSQTEKQGE